MKTYKKVLPYIIVTLAILFAGFGSIGLQRYVQSSQPVAQLTTNAQIEANNTLQAEVQLSSLPSVPVKDKNTDAVKPASISKIKPEIIQASPSLAKTPSETPIPTPVSKPSSSPTVAIATPSPTPQPKTDTYQVTLSIDGGGSFGVSVSSGKNQCDLLTQALSEGKILSLDMQYNSTFNSYAVYQINGLGKDGQVWWTYKVNGKEPPLGCSQVLIQSNDDVRWTYVGPR